MPFVAIMCGAALIGLGLDGYADVVGLVQPHDLHSPTALIPAYIGAVLVLCGIAALNEKLLKHAMHLAAMVGLIGFLGGAGMGVPKAISGHVDQPAVRSQLWMGGICLFFVALCVCSFIQARRRRRAASPPGAAGEL